MWSWSWAIRTNNAEVSAPWSHPGSSWPLGTLAVLIAAVVAGGVGVGSEILSPGLTLDLISLWPGLVPAALAAILVSFRRAWRRRLGALPQLLALSWLALGVAAHLDGWPPLPSSAAELAGPENGYATGSLEVHLDGLLEVAAGEDTLLYQVGFIRLGGEIGLAEAEEVILDEAIAVALQDSGTTSFFSYAGWRVALSSRPVWSLDLDGEIGADLTGLQISGVSAGGSGWLRLGSFDTPTPLEITRGDFEVTVPAATPVTITGNAQVPESWVEVDGGYRAPVGGDGLVITVAEGASVSIIEA
jgi:hypothetical protein